MIKVELENHNARLFHSRISTLSHSLIVYRQTAAYAKESQQTSNVFFSDFSKLRWIFQFMVCQVYSLVDPADSSLFDVTSSITMERVNMLWQI